MRFQASIIQLKQNMYIQYHYAIFSRNYQLIFAIYIFQFISSKLLFIKYFNDNFIGGFENVKFVNNIDELFIWNVSLIK